MAIQNESDTFDLGGLTVRRLGYGAMRMCGDRILGEPDDVEKAKRVARRAVDLGVDLIDTSDAYGPGTDERLLREALGPDPDAVIATKGGLLRNLDGDWIKHGEPDYLHDAVLCSLDRLRTDEIDVYQLHRPDPEVPIEDSVTALAELQDLGKIRHVALSNVDVAQLDRAREVTEIVSVQNRYHLGDREHEDVLRACEERDIGFVPWRPLGGGDYGEKGDTVAEIADAHDATPRQIALAWLLHHSPVTLPIPGTGSIEHLEANVAAAAIDLDEDEVRRLSA